MAKQLTNVQKNQLIYYKPAGRQYKNEEATPGYLNKLLNEYRNLMRPKDTLKKEQEDAKLLEDVLNGIKKIQSYNSQNASDQKPISDIISDLSLAQLLEQLSQVNPNLFKGAGLITSSSDKAYQGKLLEDFMSEFITSIDALFTNQSFNYVNSTNNYHSSGKMLDNINTKNFITDLGDNIINQTFGEVTKFTTEKIFNLGSLKSSTMKNIGKTTEDRQKANIDIPGLTQQVMIKGKDSYNVGSKMIKTDNVGLDYNITITATSTLLEKVVSALSMATFTDKNYLSTETLHLGQTNPLRVFMVVANGDSTYKLYRYARMLNCMANHHSKSGHEQVPATFYRIRAIYELTGGKQRVGNNNSFLEDKIADIIQGANRAKYLVVNSPKADGYLRVIPTADIVDTIEYNLYFNRVQSSGDFLASGNKMSMEQGLYSDISLKFDNIIPKNF